MSDTHQLNLVIPVECDRLRLDKALAQCFPEHSRARIQEWIKNEHVLVDGKTMRSKDLVSSGQEVVISAPVEEATEWLAEDIPLKIVFEDDELMVINKPAGMVAHPAAGHQRGTLVSAILNHAPQCAQLPRAGVIHRLDKDTTGLLIVPKTLTAHTFLVNELQERNIKREYLALVRGHVIAGKTIDAPIGRHPTQRIKQAVVTDGKEAITHTRIEKKFEKFTLLRVQLETGRTHQIRVHLAHIKHPIVGDQTYAGRFAMPAGASESLRERLHGFKRQALHAARLTFMHPVRGEEMCFEAELPDDFRKLMEVIEAG